MSSHCSVYSFEDYLLFFSTIFFVPFALAYIVLYSIRIYIHHETIVLMQVAYTCKLSKVQKKRHSQQKKVTDQKQTFDKCMNYFYQWQNNFNALMITYVTYVNCKYMLSFKFIICCIPRAKKKKKLHISCF